MTDLKTRVFGQDPNVQNFYGPDADGLYLLWYRHTAKESLQQHSNNTVERTQDKIMNHVHQI
jgi:hypothetical protein